jgi:sulfur relay protein TusB/DsrH
MIVIIKSGPDTQDGTRGIKMARSMSADIVLLQNGVYFTEGQRLEDHSFCRTTYMLEDDRRLRGIGKADIEKNIKAIGYGELVEMLAAEDKVIGMF